MDSVGFSDLLKRGDRDVFVRLFRRHYPELFRLVAVIVSNREIADEIVQEAFLTLYRLTTEGRIRVQFDSVRAFLVRTATNLALDKYRRTEKWRDISTTLSTAAIPNEPEMPDEALEVKDIQERFERELASLSEYQRSCLYLRIVEEYSYEEIAEVLSISADSVKTHLKRGRAALRITLSDYLGD